MYVQGKKNDDGESGVVFTSVNNEGMLVEYFESQPEGVLINNKEEFLNLSADVLFTMTQEMGQSLGMI